MQQRTPSRRSPLAALRSRTAVVAAGVGVTLAVGAGSAFAADAGSGAHQAHPATTTVSSAAHVRQAADTAAKKAASWIDPVTHYTLTAGFDEAGSHWAHRHSGQDFAVPIGTAVHAVHTGTVVKAGGNGAGDGPAYGNAIVIKHENGRYSQYAHLSRIEVHVGQHVTTGTEIGRSGNTGNTTGPHLHFEIRTTPNYGSAINPVPFLEAHGVKV